MATVSVKNMPDDLYARLKQEAARNRRSLNREIIVCLERAVSVEKISPEAVLARARQLRRSTRAHPVSHAQFSRAKRTGRP